MSQQGSATPLDPRQYSWRMSCPATKRYIILPQATASQVEALKLRLNFFPDYHPNPIFYAAKDGDKTFSFFLLLLPTRHHIGTRAHQCLRLLSAIVAEKTALSTLDCALYISCAMSSTKL